MASLKLAAALLLITSNLYAEEVTVKISNNFRDENSMCYLPPSLHIEVDSPNLKLTTAINLVKRDVIAPVSRHVRSIRKGVDGTLKIVHHRTDEKGVLERQAYSNHIVGAAFVVSCVLSDLDHTSYLVMEGSLHLRGLKFRLRPSFSLHDGRMPFTDLKSQRVAVMYSMTQVREHPFSDAAGVRVPGNRTMKLGGIDSTDYKHHKTQSYSSNRYRRAAEVFYIDILPVVDFSLYSRWLSIHQDPAKAEAEITSYLLNVFTAVDMRIQTLNLGNTKLSIRMVSPVLSTDTSSSLFIETIKVISGSIVKVSAPTLLETFNNWVTQQAGLPRHDHAMLFTSYDLIPSLDPNIVTTNNTRGLAYIGTVCQDKSVSLVEDLGAYQSENVATHELGHSLGSVHDGENNLCLSSDRYLMATGSFPQTSANALHPWLFSSCSSTYIENYLSQLKTQTSILSDCLLDLEGEEVNSTNTVNATTICENFLGEGAFPCRNYKEFSEICTDLFCRLPDTSVCQQVVSVTGMCCGNGKMCVAGNCTDAPAGECASDDNCPLGDQPSITLNGEVTTCDALNSSYCYIEAIEKVCCATCRLLESGVSGCLYGDKELGCSSSDCGTVFATSGLSYNFICCGTCSSAECVDKTSFSVAGSSTTYDCPSLIAERGRYICYEQPVHVEFCCEECERLRDKDSDDCPYGDVADCTVVTSTQCSDLLLIRSQCCETCARLQEIEATTVITTAAATTATTATATTATSAAATTATTVEATTAIATAATTKTTATLVATTEAATTTNDLMTATTVPETTASIATTLSTITNTATTTTSATTTPSLSIVTQAPGGQGLGETGYKPDGFQGCFLPPCSAQRLFNKPIRIFLVLACVGFVQLQRMI